jgi:hypothetical protein
MCRTIYYRFYSCSKNSVQKVTNQFVVFSDCTKRSSFNYKFCSQILLVIFYASDNEK